MPFNLLSFELAESERKKAEKTLRKVGGKLIMRIFVGSTRDQREKRREELRRERGNKNTEEQEKGSL